MRFPHPATGKEMTLTAPLTGSMKTSFALFDFDPDAKVRWPDLPWKKASR
jgi:hypothetical protein